MKVWQGIGTTILAVLLAVFLAVSATYFVLDRSILDADKTKQALKTAKVYETIRSNNLIPRLTDDLDKQITYTSALTKTDVIDSLREAFPQATVTKMTDTVVDSTYQWLNKKSPDISFSLLVTEEKELFVRKIDEKVTSNLDKLPVCRSASEAEQAAETLQCIPPTSSEALIHDAIMDEVNAKVQDTDDAITAETLGISTSQLGDYRNLPDYLSYLWTLNLITLPLAGLITLYLILKRRAVGLIVVGVVVLLVSIACIIAGQQLLSIPLPADTATRAFITIERNLAGDQLRLLATIGGAAGAAMIVGGILWRKQTLTRRKKKAHTHTAPEPEKTLEP